MPASMAMPHVGVHSFEAMQHRLDTDPHVMAVAAIATTGRTMRRTAAEALRTGGQLGGQLHALRPDFLDRMVARGIRLPVGLYRGDGLLNSMVCHNLDAMGSPWDSTRVPAVADATFAIPVLSPFKWQDIKRQYRRKIRQMRGTIENAAIKSIIYKSGYQGLPGDADSMIRGLPGRALARRRLRQSTECSWAWQSATRPGYGHSSQRT